MTPPLVAIDGQIQRRFCRLDNAGLLLRFRFKNAQDRQVVFDLLEGGENGLTIGRHRGVIGGLDLLCHRLAPAGIEDDLGQ